MATKAIGVRVDAITGSVIVVYAARKARGNKTWGVKGTREQSKVTRVGYGARHLYR
jgi:hypothetical protein